jgi:hypothetical protein
MDSAKKQLADRLKSATNILVTVSRDPSVDQLAACLGLTLLLSKQGKHSVAVFSGQVPSTIEFLKPEETIEKNTDSLRDFIIALDKNKADKLRYKVEDNVVRIFITPYKTSISQEDLEFSQGDFNVDVVVALGVKQQQDLDEAITAHGRILHDATVASINIGTDAGLGTIIWQDPQASSLSELVTELAPLVGEKLLDNQIATALLTGIVAETDRFSNDKTSSQTMSASSALMAAGANQQLVASKLEEPTKPASKSTGGDGSDQKKDGSSESPDGTLSIDHEKSASDAKDASDKKKTDEGKPPSELPAPQPPAAESDSAESAQPPNQDHVSNGPQLVTEPPQMGGTLSANTRPEALDPVTDPLSLPPSAPAPAPAWTPPTPPADNTTPMSAPAPPSPSNGQSQTLSEIEQSVNSPHAAQLDNARDEINKALSDSPVAPAPIQALNAQPLGDDLRPPTPAPPPPPVNIPNKPVMPLGPTPTESADTNPQPTPAADSLSPTPGVVTPNAPPPVPPPMPFQFGNNNASTPPNQSNTPL